MSDWDFDISWCNGVDCRKKDYCHRFYDSWAKQESIRLGEIYLSMFVTSPINDGKCEYFWPEKEEYSDI